MESRRKLLGIALVVSGFVALAMAALQYWRESPSAITLTPLASAPIETLNPVYKPGQLGDAPRIEVPETPPLGRTVYVSVQARQPGDGSFERPFNNLQESLCDLRPGDRLLVMAGRYPAPVRLDESCSNGTAEAPIEVYFSDDAVLAGPFEAVADPPSAVVFIARSHWLFGGMEVRPEHAPRGIVIASGSHHVTFRSIHVYSGVGSGVEILPGSEAIVIEGSHFHKLGSLGGRTVNETHGEHSGVRIFPGTRNIAVVDTKMHNILGPPVDVVPPEKYKENYMLAPSVGLTIDDAQFIRGQDEWW